MARPRVFISSTYYDLKHVRASLDLFVETIGYEAVLSEKGEVAYAHDRPLDESCYREVKNCDIYVLILGGRYGSESSESRDESANPDKKFYDRYESITKSEFHAAFEADIPVFVLIERAVQNEYQTYKKNKASTTIAYAHVDSVNIFSFIDTILSQQRNNPVQTFDRASDIEQWLKDQWAGLFREQLRKKSAQHQISSLAEQVSTLREVTDTLKTYLEAVVSKINGQEATPLIASEEQRLKDLETRRAFTRKNVVQYLSRTLDAERMDVVDMIRAATSPGVFFDKLLEASSEENRRDAESRLSVAFESPNFWSDINEIRNAMGVKPLHSRTLEASVPPKIKGSDIKPVRKPASKKGK